MSDDVTEEMVNAAMDVHAGRAFESPFGGDGYFAEIYRAMHAEAVKGAMGAAQAAQVPVDAMVNLVNYQEQCDQDGVMVKVSRQALGEVLAYVTAVRPDNKWASPLPSAEGKPHD